MKDVRLVGLDFGTTTSRCVAATARLSRNAVTGRHELSDVHEIFRSPVMLTPFTEVGLDECRLKQFLDEWLAAATSDGEGIFGGGALVTGLAAQQPNSSFLIDLIRSRIHDVLVATAGDPCLEAWLAFQANAGNVSRAHPDRWVINIDIGGGTANIALGKNGEVLRTGSLFVGARHIEVVPGTYQIVKLSRYAEALLTELKIESGVGHCLSAEDVEAIVDWQIDLLESTLSGNRAALQQPLARMHEQVPLEVPDGLGAVPDGVDEPLFCLSGGVGELAYEFLRTRRLPPTTQFGDLGIDLAHRIATDARWGTRLAALSPPEAGRATVYGLLLRATQVSGSTVYLSDPTLLPMRDVPIFGRVTGDSTAGQIRDIFQLVVCSALGGCVFVALDRADGLGVRTLGERLASTIQASQFPRETPLVFLVRENVGKALGGYASQWGTLPVKLVVLDEIEPLDARFVQLGRICEQVVPISFYGMN